jgi:hypothetical protein
MAKAREAHKLMLMRRALTEATAKYTSGGSVRKRVPQRKITLAKQPKAGVRP